MLMTIKSKRFVMLGAALSVAVVVSACSSSAGGDGTAAEPGSQAQSANNGVSEQSSEPDGASEEGDGSKPDSGGTLVVVTSEDPSTLNPDVTHAVEDQIAACVFYPSLVRLSSDLEIEPYLAKSWTHSEDGLTYTFKLQDNAKWENGDAITSSDVKYTFLNVSAKYGPGFADAAERIDSIETPDDSTVVINLKSSFGPFLKSLTCVNSAGVLPKSVFEGTDPLENKASTEQPVSGGPFILSDWAAGQRLVLTPNPNFWDPERPYLDKLVLTEIPDPESRIRSLQSGDVDYINAHFFPTQYHELVANNPDYNVWSSAIPSDLMITFNTKKDPFGDPQLHQALYQALNKKFIEKAVAFGLTDVVKSPIDQGIKWAYNPDVDLTQMYPYDDKAAQDKLDAAGYTADADGVRLKIRVVFDSSRASHAALADIVKQEWSKVGIKVVLDGSDGPSALEKIFTDYDFDVYISQGTTNGDPALGISRFYISSSIEPGTNYVNGARYSNPEVDKLFKTGADSADQNARAQAYYKVQTILAKDLPILPLIQTSSVYVSRKGAHGLDKGAQVYNYFGDAWISE